MGISCDMIKNQESLALRFSGLGTSEDLRTIGHLNSVLFSIFESCEALVRTYKIACHFSKLKMIWSRKWFPTSSLELVDKSGRCP